MTVGVCVSSPGWLAAGVTALAPCSGCPTVPCKCVATRGLACWRGCCAVVERCATQWCIVSRGLTHACAQFGSFSLASSLVPTNDLSSSFRPIVPFISGSLAGIVATTATYPFDYLRTRMAGQGMPKVGQQPRHASRVDGVTSNVSQVHNSATSMALHVMRFEGIAGLYKVSSPCLVGLCCDTMSNGVV